MEIARVFAGQPRQLVLLFGVVSLLLACGSPASADDEKALTRIEGVWKLHGQIASDGTVREPEGDAARTISRKFISNGQWCVTYADATGAVRFHHGGTYTFKGDEYAESVNYAGEETAELINQTLRFKVQIEDDTLTQKGIGNPYNEVWKRVNAAP